MPTIHLSIVTIKFEFSDWMVKAWTLFVSSQSPSIQWPEYNTTDSPYIRLVANQSNPSSVIAEGLNFRSEYCKFWDLVAKGEWPPKTTPPSAASIDRQTAGYIFGGIVGGAVVLSGIGIGLMLICRRRESQCKSSFEKL